MKTAYVSRQGLRIVIETFPDPDGGITIRNHFCSNDGFIATDKSLSVEGKSAATEEEYHQSIRGEIAKRGGTVITVHSTTIN